MNIFKVLAATARNAENPPRLSTRVGQIGDGNFNGRIRETIPIIMGRRS